MDSIKQLWKKYPRYFISGIFIFLLALVLFQFIILPRKGEMTVSFLDVGQGDAVLITAPGGNRLLYDGGPSGSILKLALDRQMSFFERTLSVVVASHPDSDHIGGLASACLSYKVLNYIDDHKLNLSSVFTSLEGTLTRENIPRKTGGEKGIISLGGGVVGYILYPFKEKMKDFATTNNSSLVLLIKYGTQAVLLTGDLEDEGEQKLIARYGKALHATILKQAIMARRLRQVQHYSGWLRRSTSSSQQEKIIVTATLMLPPLVELIHQALKSLRR